MNTISIILYLLVAENVVDDAPVLAVDELVFVLDQFPHQQTRGEGVVLFSWVFKVALLSVLVAHHGPANGL